MTVSDDFGNWLAGFIDGEGSFRIAKRTSSVTYMCRFHITLRADDAPVIDLIYRTAGFGTVYRHPNERSASLASPTVEWTLQTKAACLGLVDLLDRYPLRSKKAADYVLWREAVQVWVAYTGTRWTKGERPWERLADLRQQLHAGRVYR